MLIGHRYLHPKTRQPLTLRYIGPLPPLNPKDDASEAVNQGERRRWLGVEYDDPAKGRGHSGTYEGVQVFVTRQQGAGAFIKYPEQAKDRPLSLGKTFVEAIEERYGSITQPRAEGTSAPLVSSTVDQDVETVDKVVLGSSGSAIVVEAPGLEAVRQRMGRLEKLRDVGLDGEWVYDLGGDEAVRETIRSRMSGVKVLDLSRNLFSSWGAVARIAGCLPGLETSVLNESRIPPIPSDIEEDSLAALRLGLSRIRELHLGRSAMDQEDYLFIGRIMPNLVTLYLNNNPAITFPFREVWEKDRIFSEITTLSLDGCHISWQDAVSGIGHLPNLKSLNLSSNGIDVIPSPSSLQGNEPAVFPALTSLTLQNTPLTTWRDIDNLDRWTSGRLQHLKFTRAPLEDDDLEDTEKSNTGLKRSTTTTDPMQMSSTEPHNHRLIIIAKIASLESLNSTKITPTERRDAEIFYISFVGKVVSTSAAGTEEKNGMSNWGRYETLCEQYGRPASLAPLPTVSLGLSSKMITLRVLSANSPEPIPLRILHSAPTSLLRKKVARLLDIKWKKRDTLWTVRVAPEDVDESMGSLSGRERVSEIEGDTRSVDWFLSDGDEVAVYLHTAN